MKSKNKVGLEFEFEIDKLTNSIENIITGSLIGKLNIKTMSKRVIN
jgi:hypothetical protein